jgi:hypothetical protein
LPTEPATSHAWHWPSHIESQHTPSTQNPEAHSSPEVQLVPASFVHVPALLPIAQELPDGHVFAEQQTPSVQERPGEHVEEGVHAWPSGIVPGAGPHMPGPPSGLELQTYP